MALLFANCSLLIVNCPLFTIIRRMKSRRLSRFEAAAQSLIEGTLGRFLGGRVERPEIAARLAQALEESHEMGRTADTFTVYLHPHDWQWVRQHHPALENEMELYLVQLAQQNNMTLPQQPQVRLEADAQTGRTQVRVAAERQLPLEAETTQQFQRGAFDAGLAAQQAIQQVDAFLIVDGRDHFPLDRAIVSIGRNVENDVALNSPVVSRKHAQIRWRYGRFVIYDLGSRTGTHVNDQLITECALRPSDVIKVGNITLIYGEGATQGQRVVRPSTSSTGDSTLALFGDEDDEETSA